MTEVQARCIPPLLTGRDVAPPFSACWLRDDALDGTGPPDMDRVIAYGLLDDEGNFEPDHVVVALARGAGRTLLLDSHWAEGRALTLRVVDEAPTPAPPQRARHISLRGGSASSGSC